MSYSEEVMKRQQAYEQAIAQKLKEDMEAELIDAIIDKYGIQAQVMQLGEEMSELFVAISHAMRGRCKNNEQIKEEIADVIFMLHQMERFFGIYPHEITQIIEKKKQRMIERLTR